MDNFGHSGQYSGAPYDLKGEFTPTGDEGGEKGLVALPYGVPRDFRKSREKLILTYGIVYTNIDALY